MNGKDPEPSAEEGCWDVGVVSALYKSAESGGPVKMPHFGPEAEPVPTQGQNLPPVREPQLIAVEKPHD
jgi:glucose-fructose oxidoreductase